MKNPKALLLLAVLAIRNRSDLDGSEAARLLLRCGPFCRLLRLLI